MPYEFRITGATGHTVKPETPTLPRNADGVPDSYAVARPPTTVVRDANGIPDPYASALARRENR